jgi:hypothetical protein
MQARLVLAFTAFATAGSVWTAPLAAATPDAFRKLAECQAMTAADQRLACYDRQVAALTRAEKSKEIVVLDQAEVKRSRRSLFGFPLPDLAVFGISSKEDKSEEIKRIDSTVTDARQRRDGAWTITLADGSAWETQDALKFPPRNGAKISIEKTVVGSYLGEVGHDRSIRFHRVK